MEGVFIFDPLSLVGHVLGQNIINEDKII